MLLPCAPRGAPACPACSASLASCKLQAAVCGSLDPSACAAASRFCESQIYGGVFYSPGSQMYAKNPYNIKASLFLALAGQAGSAECGSGCWILCGLWLLSFSLPSAPTPTLTLLGSHCVPAHLPHPATPVIHPPNPHRHHHRAGHHLRRPLGLLPLP